MTDLEAIKARLAAATPGPWSDDWTGRGPLDTHWSCQPDYKEIIRMEGSDSWGGCNHSLRCDAADASLIAHAPADLAALVAEVEELRATVGGAERVAVLDALATAEIVLWFCPANDTHHVAWATGADGMTPRCIEPGCGHTGAPR